MLSRYLGSNFRRSLHYALPFSTFSTLPTTVPNIDFTDYTRIYRRQVSADELEFTLNTGASRIVFNLPDTATIGELKEELKKFSTDIENVKAFALDLAEYADSVKVTDLGNEAHYLILNDENLIKVRSTELGQADLVDQEYTKKEEMCMNSGLPFIEQQIIMNYLKRVDILNKATLGKKLFADNDIYEGKINKNVIIKNLLDGIVNDKNHFVTNERELLDYYYQLREKANILEMQREELEKKAHRNVKIKMSVGLAILCGQLAFVGVGTYSTYSWDIMEPIAYFLSLLGSIALSAVYFRLYQDYSHHGFLKHFREKELKKLTQKNGFSMEELRQLKEEIEVIEKRIKTNILIDL